MAWPRGWDRHRRSDILTVRDGSSAKWLWDIATLAILPVVLLSLAVNTFSYYHYPRSAIYALCTATLLKGAYHAAILLVVFVEPLLIYLLSHEMYLLQIVSMGISIILREGKLLCIEVVVPIEVLLRIVPHLVEHLDGFLLLTYLIPSFCNIKRTR